MSTSVSCPLKDTPARRFRNSRPKRTHSLSRLLMLAVLSCPTLVLSFDFSIDPLSPEPWSPADIIESDGSDVHIPAADLGLPPVVNVDAFSYGLDTVEPIGFYYYVAIAYSVDRAAVGAGGAVSGQVRTDGAAGDKFELKVVGFNGGIFPVLPARLLSNAPVHNLSELPNESDLDGLSRPSGGSFPVFLSVDGPVPGRNWGPGDIIRVEQVGSPPRPVARVFATAADLGLQPGDDIDGLAVGRFPPGPAPETLGADVVVYVSLTPGSPSRALTAGADAILQVFPGPTQIVVDAPSLDLQPGDNLNALTAFDPGLRPIPDIWDEDDGGNGNTYIAVPVGGDGITWHEAHEAAQGAGGHLATITSRDENAFVFGLVDSPEFWTDFFPGSCCSWGPWIGGLQKNGAVEPDGDWEWVTGEDFEYTNWRDGEPNNDGGGEDRLHFFSAPNSARADTWNDFIGDYPLPGYVVEWGGDSPYVDEILVTPPVLIPTDGCAVTPEEMEGVWIEDGTDARIVPEVGLELMIDWDTSQALGLHEGVSPQAQERFWTDPGDPYSSMLLAPAISENGFFDFQRADIFGANVDRAMCVSYFYAVNESDAPESFRVGFGSDDSASIRLNGVPVFTTQACRPHPGFADKFEVVLEPGKNLIAVYTFEAGGGYNMCFRFEDEEGNGIHVPTTLDPEGYSPLPVSKPFRSGDVNGDGRLTIADPVRILSCLHRSGSPCLPCLDAADANFDGVIDISDPIYMFRCLFSRVGCPPAPCGVRTDPERLGCEAYEACEGL